MHVILVPSNHNGGNHATSLHRLHIAAMAVVGMLLLPVLIGVTAYHIAAMVERGDGSLAITAYRQEVSQTRVALVKTRAEASRHLNALAQRLGTLQAQVMRLNALGSRLTRMAGLDLREFNFDAVPAMGGPERIAPSAISAPDMVKNLDALASELERSQARLVALETLLLDRKLNAAVTPSAWPVDGGWISSGFGVRADPFTGRQSVHEGVDLAVRFGSPIYATGDGVVSWAGEKTGSGYGLAVEVTHESGLVTRYAHASAVLVKVGDRVSKRQEIARVGTSGHSTGPHLHFEVWRNDVAVNPMPYLNQAAAAAQSLVARARQ